VIVMLGLDCLLEMVASRVGAGVADPAHDFSFCSSWCAHESSFIIRDVNSWRSEVT